MTVHPTAVSGFGSDTANYDAARPDHQPPAVDQLLKNLDIPTRGTLVEIGSGTGKFTSHLLNRPEGWKIICVEPSQDMRNTHKRNHPGVDIREGTAYEIPVDDGSIDAVICAQAFHWFADAKALKEFARILKSGGSLGLIWNFYDTKNWPEYQNRIFTEAWTHEKNCPQYRTLEWLKAFDTDVAREYYDLPLKSWEYKWQRSITDEGFWNFLRSLSYINKLPPDEKQTFKKHVEEQVRLADQEGVLTRDGEGKIIIPSTTDVRWIKRK